MPIAPPSAATVANGLNHLRLALHCVAMASKPKAAEEAGILLHVLAA